MARGRGYVENAQRRLAVQKARLRGGSAGRGRGKSTAKAAMPWDSQAQRESAGLTADSADARAGITANYDRAQSELGFGTGADNPYSETAENKKALTNDQRGIGTTAGNNLYAGSTLNAQSAARSSYDKRQTGLEAEFADAQGEYTGGLAKTARDEALGSADIKGGALDRAAASEPASLGVGRPGGRGRLNGPKEGKNVRRPAAARAANAKARALNKKLSGARGARGRGAF